MANVRGTTLTGTLTSETPIRGNITVGTVNITGADMSNYYDKEDVNTLLESKSDVDHVHDEYALKTELPSIDGLATEDYVNQMIEAIPDVDLSNCATKEDVNTLLEGKAEKNHTHDITWDGGETVDLQTAFDYVAYYKANKNHTHDQYLTEHQDISGKADITYVDDAINTALNGIESELDEIIGEEE